MPLEPMKFPNVNPEGMLDSAIYVKAGKLYFPLYAEMNAEGRFNLDPQATYEMLRGFFPELPPYVCQPIVGTGVKDYEPEELENMGHINLIGGRVWMQTNGFNLWGIKWTERKIALSFATLVTCILMSLAALVISLLGM